MSNTPWDYGLASMFRDRDNPSTQPIGACIGKVLQLNPPRIQIQDNNFIINADKLYICNQILERKTKYHDHIGQYSQNGNASIDCHPCSGGYTSSGAISSVGEIHLEEVWKVGDFVLVIPSQSEQQFFVVDVLRKVNGCNNEMA